MNNRSRLYLTFFTALHQRIVDVTSIDRRSLAFVRILLGSLLAIAFFNFALYAPQLMSDGGVFPREMSLDTTRSAGFSLFLASGSLAFQYALLGAGIISALLFASNVAPRASILACWVLFYSATFRSTSYNFGICPAMLGVLFWSLFVPWRSAPTFPMIRKECLKDGARVTHWALWGLFLSCAAISYGAGLAKLRNYDAWFTDFSALRIDLAYYANINPVTRALAQIPYFFEIASPMVVLVELGAPIALLTPFFRRMVIPLTLLVATAVYVGIAFSIHVGIFPLIPLTGFYLFIRGEFWDWCSGRSTVLWVSRAAQRARPTLTSVTKVIHSAISRSLPYLGTALVTCFLILVTYHQTTNIVPQYVQRTVARLASPILGFAQVKTDWAWIYGGGIRNKFLIVRATTAKGPLLVNMTSVTYRGVLYNFFMNYSNSILRGKDDPERLLHYAKFLCSPTRYSIDVMESSALIQSIELLEIPDPNNKLRNLPANDQRVLTDAIKGHVPFFSFNCLQNAGSAKHLLHQEIGEVRPGSALQLPLLGWSQQYGVLMLNRAVEGAPISIRGRIFSQGFGTHANSRIRLSTKGLRRFKALVGVDDEKGKSVYASALVRIEGDGREIFRSPVLSSPTLPLPIDIDITGVSELVLITEDANVGLGNNKNCDDHVSWADPVVE